MIIYKYKYSENLIVGTFIAYMLVWAVWRDTCTDTLCLPRHCPARRSSHLAA